MSPHCILRWWNPAGRYTLKGPRVLRLWHLSQVGQYYSDAVDYQDARVGDIMSISSDVCAFEDHFLIWELSLLPDMQLGWFWDLV